ncbi:globin [Halomonas sp. THAF12]|uniref:globin n=1 Tax=Halomonas sp. B23F22_10 TaxID=3459515 RepID=UPI00373EE753
MDIVKIFDASYARALARRVRGRDFFDAFYERFLATSPEVAEKFQGIDMSRQQAMLKKSFYQLLTLYAACHDSDYLGRVAVLHGRHQRDIRPALYDQWLEAMIATLWDFDPRCDDEVELAWRLVMSPGIVYMKFHYDRTSAVGQDGDASPGDASEA